MNFTIATLLRCVTLLVVGCAVGMFAAEPVRHVANTPAPQDPKEWPEWKERLVALNERAKSCAETPLVFLGDSITEMWNADDAGKNVWEKYWEPLKALNLGVAGDRTEHVLWRIEQGNLDGLKPKLIVLMIGTNNAGFTAENPAYKCTPQQTAEGILAILRGIQAKCPAAKVLLLAIFPRGEDDRDPLRKLNRTVNGVIQAYADNKKVFFLDIGAKFTQPNGDLSVVNSPDMLHLSEAGYEIWAREIKPKVSELMK